MKANYLLLSCLLLIVACSKKNDTTPGDDILTGDVVQKTETVNGITYRSFTKQGESQFKGILVMGSGNDENNPAAGALNGAAETDLCLKAAQNGYASAIVQYQKPPAGSDWNSRAQMMGQDYDKCIGALSTKYGIDKSKSVVGGFSYASFMLLTDIALNNTLAYSKGVLAACGATDAWKAQNFKIPVFSISCSGNNEGNYSGRQLYDQIPANSPVKAKSAGITDGSCNTHCNGNGWTAGLYTKLVEWLP